MTFSSLLPVRSLIKLVSEKVSVVLELKRTEKMSKKCFMSVFVYEVSLVSYHVLLSSGSEP